MMKISKLPDKKEWDRIVDEAFTSNEEHRFSQRYVSHKNEMLGGINMKRRTVNNKSKNNSRKLMLSVGAVAAAFVLIPTGAFLASNGGGASAPGTEIDDPSETTVTEEATENKTEDTISLADVESYGFKKLKLNYIPDSLVYNEDGPYAGKYHDEETGGGMSTEFCVADKTEKCTHINFGYDSAEYELDGKHVIIRFAPPDDFYDPLTRYGRLIIVKFNDSPYIAILHISDVFSDEEALKVCEGMELVDCEKNDFHLNIWHDKDPEIVKENVSNVTADINGFKLDMEKVKLFNIGDTFINDFKKELGTQCCDITVKSARIQDNFDGVKTDCDGNEKDYSEWIDENGRLKPNTRSWYSEEELCAMSEAVATEEMQMRVVVVDLTYTNNNDSELMQVVNPYMFVYKDGNANTADFQPMKDGASSVQNSLGIVTTYGGMFSYDSDKKAEGNLLSLGAGEGADVQVAFLINAGDVGALLFSADPLGSNVKSRDYYDCPIVDLREIR